MTTTTSLKVQPIAGRIGAEIGEIDLRDALTNETIGEIRKALVHYKVIFFRTRT
ncbi:hypothetical protein [Leptolyngbya sp. UWPOB_LEPTO1]|uniref:hypothetical protein n=1 Tax=Leptolyngbya sp. UWPOB_LEPTO1 TaxID=2815653 RepID=UPI0025811CE4|nr:hypothetical protein [Leptolyngbya sp. UWPOB_LEPTO1]